MKYKKGIYYFMEPADEVITFNPNVHTTFEFDNSFADGKTLTPIEKLVYGFFYKYACDAWKDGENHPDHDVAIKITHADLADLFDVEEKAIKGAIQHLIEYELLGVVLLSSGYYAYHIVL